MTRQCPIFQPILSFNHGPVVVISHYLWWLAQYGVVDSLRSSLWLLLFYIPFVYFFCLYIWVICLSFFNVYFFPAMNCTEQINLWKIRGLSIYRQEGVTC